MWFWKGHLEKEKMVVVMIWQEWAAVGEWERVGNGSMGSPTL